MDDSIKNYLPFWSDLPDEQKEALKRQTMEVSYEKGSLLHHGSQQCSGLEIVKTGRVRVFITSPDGKEITLYRLLDGDICVLSASCIIKSLTFDINMEFEEDSHILVIPKNLYKELSDTTCAVKDFTLELVADSFSNVMWVMQQLVFSNMGKRLADALIEHSALCQSTTLEITHEALARDLGTAREVVSRLLKQFQLDGMIEVSRGAIYITDMKRLQSL